MKAIRYRAYGGPEVLEVVDVERPQPAADQVLIQVAASSVNPVDWKMASGHIRLLFPAKFPQVPGFDVAGRVVEVGPGVTKFAVGDRVFARLNKGIGAASAEYTVGSLADVAAIPEGMDDGEAAGLPLAGMTALQALRDYCGMSMSGATQRVLVVGASGGVGHLAVQIARAAGAYVVGVCSAKNAPLVLGLGAQEVIDYAKPDAYAGQAPFDIVFDCVGGSPKPWLARLTPNGQLASCAPGAGHIFRSLFNGLARRKVYAVRLKANAADLEFLGKMVADGNLRVIVDSRFPLEQLKEAWQRSIAGRSIGKIVVDVATP